MRRAHHLALLALAALAPTWLALDAGHSSAPRIVGARASFDVSANGEYLIQFAPRAAQRSQATDRLDAEGIEQTRIAINLPISLATLTPQEVAIVADTPGVVAISPNRDVQATATQPDPPSWGLDRTDQADLPLDRSFSYLDSAGAGTTIYIIDSGINTAHVEFAGRLLPGFFDPALPGGINDCFGHGTHVAGTAAGTTFGIAKLATLVPVRVLDCSGQGSTKGVVQGIDWVISQHVTGRAVANMSFGGGKNAIVDFAVEKLIADGVAVTVAAGNGNSNRIGIDACGGSPAGVRAALTVGATTDQDTRSGFSNFGPCVDLFAPGSNIVSAWFRSATDIAMVSGTSMATPHVAGALAVLWTENPGLTAPEVQQLLVATATRNRLSNVGTGSPNLLLYLSLPLRSVSGGGDALAPAQRCDITQTC